MRFLNSCRTVDRAKPDCRSSSRTCSSRAPIPNSNRNNSALTPDDNNKASVFMPNGYTAHLSGLIAQYQQPADDELLNLRFNVTA